MHAEILIGNCTIMFTQSNELFPPAPAQLFIYVPDADAAFARAVEKGAVSLMEPADQDYGRSCGVRDVQGNTWWITSVTKA